MLEQVCIEHEDDGSKVTRHVRICSCALTMTTNDNPSRTITLFCWILDVSDRPFPVDIDDSTTVAHLKEAILKKNVHTLPDLDPHQLVVFKVSPFIFVQTILIPPPQDVHPDSYDSYSEE
jgi:hypothetical protein